MRIAYVVQHSAGPESGVFKKIISQIKQWTSSGADVELVIASRCDTASDWAGSLPNIPVSLCRFTNTAGTFFRFPPFIDAVRKACPDLIYLRSGLYAPFLEHLFRVASVVLEVNTDDWA